MKKRINFNSLNISSNGGFVVAGNIYGTLSWKNYSLTNTKTNYHKRIKHFLMTENDIEGKLVNKTLMNYSN